MASDHTPSKRSAPEDSEIIPSSPKRQRRDLDSADKKVAEEKDLARPSRQARSSPRGSREHTPQQDPRPRSQRRERDHDRPRERRGGEVRSGYRGSDRRGDDRRDHREHRDHRNTDRGSEARKPYNRERPHDQDDRDRDRRGRPRSPPIDLRARPSQAANGHSSGVINGSSKVTPSAPSAMASKSSTSTKSAAGDVMAIDGPKLDSEEEMARMMGFKKFRSTKNTKVPGNDKLYATRKEKKTEYRQYMNRVGGFNRPLSPSRQN